MGAVAYVASKVSRQGYGGQCNRRSLGIALGYQELNDHDDLRYDPTLAMAVGKVDPLGNTRKLDRDRGRALAGHATLNRLETAPSTLDSDRPNLKILHSPQAFERLFVDLMLDAHDQPPNQIIIDRLNETCMGLGVFVSGL